jgi:hypothetical protein
VASDRKARELELYHSFKKNPTPETFHPLYESFKPIINSAVFKNMHKSTIPKAAHLAHAAQSFYEAIRSFDPSKGSLASHVYGAVENKGKRLNYKYQNIGYIPEARASKFGPIENAIAMLRADLGREPSAIEVADEASLSVKTVETFMKERRGSRLLDEYSGRGDTYFQSDKAMQLARDIQYDLIPAHRVVLEHAIGLNGKQIIAKANGQADKDAIAKATGLSLPQVNSAFKTISRKFRQHMGAIGSNTEEEDDE